MANESLGVVGLGYVGLPLAVQAAEKGYQVQGIDLNSDLVDKVNNRETPYVNDERFRIALEGVAKTSFTARTDYARLDEADNIAICVPTPTTNNVPDLGYVFEAARSVGQRLRPGQLVALESTINPGVTRSQVLPILQSASGLKVGEDFFLAHCPERIDPGNDRFFVGNLNRVVGGITMACTERATTLYESIIDADIVPMGSTEEAEFVKSWENSQRNLLIAAANSAAIICDALDMNVDNIQRGLESKVQQFGLSLANPDIGPGGHCIPEDIHYVIKAARQNGIKTGFLEAAAELNDDMPKYAVHSLKDMAAKNGEQLENLDVALLGLAYKPDIDDMRRSPSIEVGYELVRHTDDLIVHDPYADVQPKTIKGAKPIKELDKALDASDVVFIGTAHTDYIEVLTAEKLKEHGIRYVFDGRNCLDREAIKAAGIQYKGIGK